MRGFTNILAENQNQNQKLAFGGVTQPQEMDFSPLSLSMQALDLQSCTFINARREGFSLQFMSLIDFEHVPSCTPTIFDLRSFVSDEFVRKHFYVLYPQRFNRLRHNYEMTGSCYPHIHAQCDYKESCRAKHARNVTSNRRKHDKYVTKIDHEISDVISKMEKIRSKVGNKNPKNLQDCDIVLQRLKNKRAVAHSSESYPGILNKLHFVIEYLKSIREVIGEKTLNFVMDVFTTLYNIYNNSSWTSISLNISTLFLRYFPKDYADYAFTAFCMIFDVTSAHADSKYDLIKAFFTDLFTNVDNFVNDCLWKKIEEFFLKIASLYASLSKLVAYETLDLKTAYEKYQIFKKALPDTKDIIMSCFQAMEFVFGHWQQILSGEWDIFSFGKDEAKAFESEVRLLESAFVFAVSNKEVELKDRFNMTLSSFESRLEAAITEAENLARVCTSVQQKLAISNFIKTLTQKRLDWYARLAEAPSRPEPYGIKLAGPSSCGKSYISGMLSKIILNAYGEDSRKRGSIVLTNIMEKFESTINPSHKIIVCDDVANSKNEKPNYDRILNYVNTIPRPLEKAEASEKGKFYPGNVGLLVTTNVDDLAAQKHSNCAESILRRFALHVDIEIREEFQNSFGGLARQPKTRFDVYRLILKRFDYIDEDGKIVWDIIPRHEWVKDGSFDKDFHFMCLFIAKDVRNHRRTQANQMNAQKEFDEAKFCPHCHIPTMLCLCEQLSEEDLISVVDDYDSDEELQQVEQNIAINNAHFEDDESLSSDDSDEHTVEAEAHFSLGFLRNLPTTTLWDLRTALHGSMQGLTNLHRNAIFCQLLYTYRRNFFCALCIFLLSPFISILFGRFFGIIALFSSIYGSYQIYNHILEEIDVVLQSRVDYFSSTWQRVKDNVKDNIMKYFAFGAAFYAIYNAYKVVRPLLQTEDKTTYFDNFCPIFDNMLKKPSPRHIARVEDERDYKEGYSRLPPKMTKTAATTTPEDLIKMLHKSLRVVLVKSQGQLVTTVNGLIVASNIIMIPSHALPETDEFDIETSMSPLIPSAKTKDQRITKKMVYILPEKDMALVHLPSSPASNSFLDFFPETAPTFRTRATKLVWKSHDNEIYESEQAIRPFINDQGKSQLHYLGMREKPGFIYGNRNTVHEFIIDDPYVCELEFNSFAGLCGGMYVDTSKALIYGYHVAGLTNGGRTGWLTSITRPMIQKGIDQLKETSYTLVPHSAGEIKVNTYGTNYEIFNEPPLYVREDGLGKSAIVTYFGKVKKDGENLASRARTPYIPTPFKGVEDILGPCKHIPPVHPNDIEKSMKTLNKLHDPVQHYEHKILERAVEDYAQQTLAVLREHKDELKSILRIYTQEEAMDGTHDGNLCGLPNATSAGFPIGKSKKHCLVRDPFDESVVKVPREFNDAYDIQSEIDRTIDAWSKGERSEPIYKANSKVNELLPKKKAIAKVRKFYGSPFANFVASRRALGGIPEFMRRFWRETECLVGINPMSKEWEDLKEFLCEYGEDNMIAGDFGAFDTRMAAQITSSAAKIFERWYKEIGLNEEELMLVRGALSDIIHPNILYEGDLYRFANGNPSGNLITVQLNSICNSIMMRYAYYALNPRVTIPFCKNVKLATFGDDNNAGVHRSCGWYNHTACQKVFENLAIEYTMAEKEAKSVPYLHLSKISFLKRSFVKHDGLGMVVAPIEHDSIMKKFYFVKKTTESPLSHEEQFGAYTDNSFREAYLHGQSFYDDFQNKMKEIVQLNPSLRPHVVWISYAEMTQILKHDYELNLTNPRKLFAESMGCDEENIDTMFDSDKIV